MTKKALILWNPGSFADRLRGKLGADCVATSEAALLATEFQNYSGAVVLAEVGWGQERLSDLGGVAVVRNILRAKLKLRLPVLFVSFLSPRQIRLGADGNEILNRQIVGAMGHDYLDLPSTPRQWVKKLSEIQPLTNLQFADVFNNFCDVRGLISESVHKLKNQCRTAFIQPEPEVGRRLRGQVVKVFDEIVELLGGTQGASLTRDQLLSEVDFEVADERAIQTFLTHSEGKFGLLIADEDGAARPPAVGSAERLPWKVLMLDDEPETLLAIRKALAVRGVDSLVARTVAEAERLVTADTFNELLVVVSDYRLFAGAGGVERLQRRQGYDFLFELSQRNRLTHLIALSGLSRKFLLESFQKYNARVDVYSKHDLGDSGAVNLFADAVVDRGRETYEALCSRPLVGEWPALKPFYAAYRQAEDYRQREAEISGRARRFVVQYQSLLESRDEADRLMPGLEVLENLSAKMKNRSPQQHPEAVEYFKNKLIARRIALWLRLTLGYDSKQILAALRGHMTPESYLQALKSRDGSDEEEARKTYSEHIKSYLTTSLCLSFPNTAENILVEEQQWLASEVGGDDWDRPLGVDRQIAYLVHIQVEMFFDAHLELLGELKKKSADVSPKSGRPVVTGIRAAKEVLEAVSRIVSTSQQRARQRELHAAIERCLRARLGGGRRVDEFISWLRGSFG